MKLDFKFSHDYPLEVILAITQYSSYWKENGDRIVASLEKHSGMQFKQTRITVQVWDKEISRAGTRNKPMQLSAKHLTSRRVASTIMHELAHRLVIGNGIESSEATVAAKSRYNYYVHRHIYLFLYDVYSEILGKDEAMSEVSAEKLDGRQYYAAWTWALAMNYPERQATLERLKRRYKVK